MNPTLAEKKWNHRQRIPLSEIETAWERNVQGRKLVVIP